jgi:hypothetical protein
VLKLRGDSPLDNWPPRDQITSAVVDRQQPLQGILAQLSELPHLSSLFIRSDEPFYGYCITFDNFTRLTSFGLVLDRAPHALGPLLPLLASCSGLQSLSLIAHTSGPYFAGKSGGLWTGVVNVVCA